MTAHQVVAATVAVVAVAAVIALTLRFSVVAIGFFVAVLLSAALRPMVGLLERRIGRVAAAAVVHAAVVAALAVFVLTALPLLIEQVKAILAELPRYYESLRTAMLETDSSSLRRIASALPRTIATPASTVPIDSMTIALAWASQAISITLTVTAVVLLSFYWTLEGELTVKALVLLVPLEHRAAVASLVSAAGDKLSAYVRGQVIVCVAVGVLAFLAYSVIGLPNSFALALMAGVLEAVPVIGPTLGALPAGLLALTIDPSLALWVALSTVLIQFIENYFLVPRVMDREVGVNPLVTLLAITGFGSVLGIVGAILAIPLAALVQLVVGRYLIREDGAVPPPPAGRDQASLIRYESQVLALDVRKLVRSKDDPQGADRVEDAVEAIAVDLDRLLADPTYDGPERRR